ncbi:hypothetical protein CROQUDRAFT_650533 [Cronartium quercuum f. sp. fusiforme G11]|uniref:Glycosyl transferase family 25 domain-containing protein n=1 Tax=Cronartium quercuum f. sp. fusiforme G11 TaxID=708437 RepID=A0A9P6THC9_9BASI|nr:hypothetical protein CROQUDRAFT_650533 [Cronartium quercuum f. sp. fusiforme G11]
MTDDHPSRLLRFEFLSLIKSKDHQNLEPKLNSNLRSRPFESNITFFLVISFLFTSPLSLIDLAFLAPKPSIFVPIPRNLTNVPYLCVEFKSDIAMAKTKKSLSGLICLGIVFLLVFFTRLDSFDGYSSTEDLEFTFRFHRTHPRELVNRPLGEAAEVRLIPNTFRRVLYTIRSPFKLTKPPLIPVKARSPTLGFDTIYVVHLERRTDRYNRMEALARLLGLYFTYVPALSADNELIARIRRHVQNERQLEGWPLSSAGLTPPSLGFRRHSLSRPVRADKAFYLDQPSPMTGDLESLARHVGWTPELMFLADAYALHSDPLSIPLGIVGADVWALDEGQRSRLGLAPDQLPSSDTSPPALPVITSSSMESILRHRSSEGPEPDYYRFNRRQQFRPGGMAEERLRHWWNVLSDAAIACWHSHLSVIRTFVESKDRMALILEDDVDLEVDIEDRLQSALNEVPRDWDILLLGHCWSEESQFPPISPGSALRPAFAPKCNHAYAVSKRGARKLIRHLRSPAFAYSRPFDKAILHLIATERINAFSFHPSIVIQTKDLISDIAGGNGSRWKDELQNSALAAAGISVPLSLP